MTLLSVHPAVLALRQYNRRRKRHALLVVVVHHAGVAFLQAVHDPVSVPSGPLRSRLRRHVPEHILVFGLASAVWRRPAFFERLVFPLLLPNGRVDQPRPRLLIGRRRVPVLATRDTRKAPAHPALRLCHGQFPRCCTLDIQGRSPSNRHFHHILRSRKKMQSFSYQGLPRTFFIVSLSRLFCTILVSLFLRSSISSTANDFPDN